VESQSVGRWSRAFLFVARLWRYRLRVRTWPSQGQNPGSNPGIATNFKSAKSIFEYCDFYSSVRQFPSLRAKLALIGRYNFPAATLILLLTFPRFGPRGDILWRLLKRSLTMFHYEIVRGLGRSSLPARYKERILNQLTDLRNIC
jgi:hypothetical protein